MKKRCFAQLLSMLGLLTMIASTSALATTFTPPATDDSVIGAASYTTTNYNDTLVSIAKQYDLGLNAMIAANPSIAPNSHLPAGLHIVIPGSHVLPPMARSGIIINLPEMRMYFYTSAGELKSYPIGIGRVGKTIPITETKVTKKVKDPIWIPPDDIRAFNQEQGVVLPTKVVAGPDNPLGPYAIYLKIPTYLIHSTIFPESIGRRASFGCIRMHKSDIEDFYPLVDKGTKVTIIDMPNKVGWHDSDLYLETHPPLEEHEGEYYVSYSNIVDSIETASKGATTFIDWQEVADLDQMRDGTPHEIGLKNIN
jgi:L,D-transpeptidase ErfK/SrfK